MGADVIKLEPPDGDLTRYASPRINGLSAYFVQQNSGKRNISIDLSSPQGAEIAIALAGTADVLVENYRAGVMQRLGLGVDELTARYPRLDLRLDLRLRRHRAVGRPAGLRVGRRRRVGAHQAAGRRPRRRLRQRPAEPRRHLHRARADDGRARRAVPARAARAAGQSIDVSMAETMLFVNDHLNGELWDGPEDPAAIRNFGPGDYIVFRTADGTPVIISGHPAEKGTFAQFLRGVRHPRGRRRPALRRRRQPRRQRRRAQARSSSTAAARIPDWPTFEARSSGVGLAVGRVLSAAATSPSPTGPRERGAISEVSDRAGGTIRIPNPPWHFSDAEVGLRGGPKYRGEDNREVLAERARLRRRHDRRPRGRRGAVEPGAIRAHEPALARRRRCGRRSASCRPRTTAGRTRSSGTATGRSRSSTAARSGCRARTRIDVTGRYPELQPLAAELGGQRAILDGELVVLDERGRPRFELIQRKEMDHLEAAYFVFDVLADRPPRHRSPCRTRSAGGCCASCSTTGPTGRCRPTASATVGRCSTPRSPRSWRA